MPTPIEQMLATVAWEVVPPRAAPSTDATPYATHSGVLQLGDKSLRCYRLNTGEAVFEADYVVAFLGGAG